MVTPAAQTDEAKVIDKVFPPGLWVDLERDGRDYHFYIENGLPRPDYSELRAKIAEADAAKEKKG